MLTYFFIACTRNERFPPAVVIFTSPLRSSRAKVRCKMNAHSQILYGITLSYPVALGYSETVDMWSIGVCMYILLSGNVPFSNDHGDLYKQIERGEYNLNGEGNVRFCKCWRKKTLLALLKS